MMTYRTSTMVTEDSAMLVDKTTLQWPLSAGRMQASTCSLGTKE
jgi:hypothetical protein